MNLSKNMEIDKNLEAFLLILPSLLSGHEGEYALLRDGKVIAFYNNALDAQIAGNQKFEDGIFSIQCVKKTTEELGYFSYAINSRRA